MSETWRLLLDGRGDSAWNMAVDEALLRLAEAPVLRIYEWTEPAVSLGYFQAASIAPVGRSFIRRYTGGGLVDHADDVTYTIAAPREHRLGQLSTSESYSQIHQAVAAALEAIGLPVELSSCCQAEADACFQRAVKFDVLYEGRKIAGAAQRRTRQGFLQQGSILLPDRALHGPLRAALAEVFGSVLKFEPVPGELTAAERALAEELRVSRYATESWNRQH